MPTAAPRWRGFNPRTHEECDLPHNMQPTRLPVSIHALTRSATNLKFSIRYYKGVSIHALTRSATRKQVKQADRKDGFNPRTHEECDQRPEMERAIPPVSIHALTRSATRSLGDAVGHIIVSIHALTRSATFLTHQGFNLRQFQSTHSRGVRRKFVRGVSYHLLVSIHALTRSATQRPLYVSNKQQEFQSTHSRGVRLHSFQT